MGDDVGQAGNHRTDGISLGPRPFWRHGPYERHWIGRFAS